MHTFSYEKPLSIDRAAGSAGKFIAGGTTLVDLMKLDIEQPAKLVDITALPLTQIEPLSNGGVRIGAMVRNSELAWHPYIQEHYAVLSQAILSGASPQLRNMATTGGNLLQRTRCPYFRDLTSGPCNKRNPGTGCSAIGGFHRTMAILGVSEHCIATHPSDMCVAMTALDATIYVQGAKGKRTISIHDFYKLPGDTPHIENALEPGDLITHVELPSAIGQKQAYLKLRDRASYEFALASAAIVANVEGGHIRSVRVAMGGVGTRPWRASEAEAVLNGKAATPANFQTAAEAALRNARPHTENAFKVELARRCIVRALKTATA